MSDSQSDPEPLDAEFEPAETTDIPGTEPRPRSGATGLITVFLLASLVGGGLGFAGARYFPAPVDAIDAGAASEREALSASLTGLETRLSALEAEDPEGAARRAAQRALSDIAPRLDALESTPAGTTDLSAIEDRLTALEAAEPADASQAVAPFDSAPLEARLASLEAGQAELQSRTQSALDAVQQPGIDPQILQNLTDRIAALEAAADNAAQQPTTPNVTEADLAAVLDRVERLEAALGETRQLAEGAQSAASNAQTTADSAASAASTPRGEEDRQLAARALALTALRDMAARGEPFEAERAALARLWRGNQELAALANYSRAGVPAVTDLADAYPGRAIRDAGTERQRWFGLIELQRIDPEAGETGALALTALSEDSLADGDLDTAVTVTEQLDGDALAAAQDWLVQARARLSVDRHIEALRAQLTQTATERGADPS